MSSLVTSDYGVMDFSIEAPWIVPPYQGSRVYLPWFVNRRVASEFEPFQEWIREPYESARPAFVAALKRPRPADVLFAGYASYWSLGHLDAPGSLRRVEAGLKVWPNSSVLHIERGRWLAYMSQSKPALRAKAISSWKRGRDAREADPAIAENLLGEIEYLNESDPAEPYPGIPPCFTRMANAVAKCIDVPLLEFMVQQTAERFLIHRCEEWFSYFLARNVSCGRVVPAQFSDLATPEHVLGKYGLDPSRRISAIQSRGRTGGSRIVDVTAAGHRFSATLRSTRDAARLYNAVLHGLEIDEALYELKGIPDPGTIGLFVLSGTTARCVQRSKCLDLLPVPPISA